MKTTTPADDCSDLAEEVDLAALQLALDLTLANDPPDPGRVEQVRTFLEGELPYLPARPWREVAEFCSYVQQTARLDIFFGEPPCHLTEAEADAILAKGPIPAQDGSGIDISSCDSARLFKRMLKAGVSKYHPNPVAALAAAKRAKRGR